jgi:hypothetical protein
LDPTVGGTPEESTHFIGATEAAKEADGKTVFESTKERKSDKRQRSKNDNPSDIEGFLGPWGGYVDEKRVMKPNEVSRLCKAVHKFQFMLIYNRQSVGQSVLVPGTHLGPVTNFISFLEISFRLFRGCYFVAPFLTRGRVYNLLYNCFWVLPEQSLLGQSPTELTAILYCLISDCVPSSWPLTTRRDYGGGILTHLHTGKHRSRHLIIGLKNGINC